MKINDIIDIADTAYPDHAIRECWDYDACQPKTPTLDTDPLALFLARELKETFDPDAEDLKQLEDADRIMTTAYRQVFMVAIAFYDKAIEIKKAAVAKAMEAGAK